MSEPLPQDPNTDAPVDNVTPLPGAQRSADGAGAQRPSDHDSGDRRIWWIALGAIAFIGLVVVAATQSQRAAALEDAVSGLNAQLQTTRVVLDRTEADLETTRSKLGVYSERMDAVRGRVDSLAAQLGELGELVSEESLPAVD